MLMKLNKSFVFSNEGAGGNTRCREHMQRWH